jgi:hypothetical protein
MTVRSTQLIKCSLRCVSSVGKRTSGMNNRNSQPLWHNGNLFRSKQEARWAFFFDRLEIQYDHECIVSDLYYLPDFRVLSQEAFPQESMFFEVKPVPNRVQEEKCRMLSAQGRAVGLLRYLTKSGTHSLEEYPKGNELLVNGELEGRANYRFCVCRYCEAVGFQRHGVGSFIPCCDLNKADTSGYVSWRHEKLMVAYTYALTYKLENPWVIPREPEPEEEALFLQE